MKYFEKTAVSYKHMSKVINNATMKGYKNLGEQVVATDKISKVKIKVIRRGLKKWDPKIMDFIVETHGAGNKILKAPYLK